MTPTAVWPYISTNEMSPMANTNTNITAALTEAYKQRAKAKVIMTANQDNVIIRTLAGFVFGLYEKAIARAERKHGKLI